MIESYFNVIFDAYRLMVRMLTLFFNSPQLPPSRAISSTAFVQIINHSFNITNTDVNTFLMFNSLRMSCYLSYHVILLKFPSITYVMISGDLVYKKNLGSTI